MPLPPHPDPGAPDSRSPGRYLWWLARRQTGRVLRGSFWGTASFVGLAIVPYLVGRAIDDGLRPKNLTVLAWWTAALVVLAAVNAYASIMRHRTMTQVRIDAGLRTIQVVTRAAARLGAALPRRVSTGEVVNIGTSDVNRIANFMTAAGPGVGSVFTCLVVAVLVLRLSVLLGVLVLVGVPLIVGVVTPLMSRYRRSMGEYRELQGALTARAGDIVAGLRVLRGIGGESLFAGRYRRDSRDVRDAGYRVGGTVSWIIALAKGLPGLFLALVTWVAAREVAAHEVTFGDMVAVYGYAGALVLPVFVFIESGLAYAAGLVAARRVTNILNIPPDVDEIGRGVAGPPEGSDLCDPVSGVSVKAGRLTGIACADAKRTTTILERLARYGESEASFGGVRLSDMAIDEVRRRILLSGNEAHLFAGTLREMVSPPNHPADAAIAEAVRVAAAGDIVSGLADGLDSPVDVQARTLSGGQRQRVRLVRSLLAEPEVLMVPEPTSAVDANTEALIAERLRETRSGRTTVVTSSSPLLLDRCDTVIFLGDDGEVATGTHVELLDAEPGYHALVMRGIDELADEGAS
ncbi:MAG TPA: ABC transporter ATP-binding protein [Stackebrandtia sp.]|uniref:ABC transporter ATP-binding protein n=1 Tax=Stackebrandtia sp. TaxID=2023065 RepID=UPI002D5FF313|nr:ABC transporter ATP-binding protein [Stackebrandtia sp.]HZE37582.1 ABC transporter ATP-binding protein [Stackebrandtia sp.]